MRAIIITGWGIEHRYVGNALANILGNHLSGILVERAKHVLNMGTFRRLRGRYSYLQVTERLITKTVRRFLRYNEKQNAILQDILGTTIHTGYGNNIYETSSVNNDYAYQLIKSMNPDFLFVYGTSVVSDKVISLAQNKTLNLHTGVSPFYRGSDSFFWPLYDGKPEMVGATVHECTSSLDGGSVYGRALVRLEEEDDPFRAFAKCVKAGAELYATIAQYLISGKMISLEKQDLSIGKEYRFIDRTFWHDIKMEYLIRTGKLRRIIRNYQKGKIFT